MKHLLPKRLLSLSRISLALTLACVLAPATRAQGTLDLVGIYTANDGTGTSEIPTLAPGFTNQATAYVCLTGIVDPLGVAGYEFSIDGVDISDGVVVTSWNMTWGPGSTVGPLNVTSPPDFIVGQNKPLPLASNICLFSFTFFVTDSSPKAFTIHPAIAKQSIPGKGAYIGQSSIGNIIPLKYAAGGESYVAFSVNTGTACTPRFGVMGTNPTGYECTTAPFSGLTWTATIDTTPLPGNTTISTILVTGLGGGVNNVPMFGFEMLSLPPYLLNTSFGEHVVPIPSGLTGASISTQGARIELDPFGNVVIVLLNAQDLIIG
jgi:hypothetical protein